MSNYLDDFPRRNRLEKMVPAEIAIREAMLKVEEMGAHLLLTEAIVLLQEARDAVGDYVDGK